MLELGAHVQSTRIDYDLTSPFHNINHTYCIQFARYVFGEGEDGRIKSSPDAAEKSRYRVSVMHFPSLCYMPVRSAASSLHLALFL